jgi:ABC-type Mn2+/Zn2+ transport system ATPase subunit
MAIDASTYELLGVSVGKVGPVKSLVHLELSTGVTALYGLNGAGKSWLLRLVSAALTAVRPTATGSEDPMADLHLRLTSPESPAISAFESELCTKIASAVREHREFWHVKMRTIRSLTATARNSPNATWRVIRGPT